MIRLSGTCVSEKNIQNLKNNNNLTIMHADTGWWGSFKCNPDLVVISGTVLSILFNKVITI